jgi:membrane protein
MRNKLRQLSKNKSIMFVDQLLYRIGDDEVLAIGAQLTYFLILSVFPFLVMFLNIISYTPLVREDVLLNLTQYLPLEVQKLINGFAVEIIKTSSQGLLSIAAIFGLWTASSGISAVMRALNKAYDTEETRPFYTSKLLSIFFTIILLLSLTIVFLTLVFGEVLGNRLFAYFGLTDIFLRLWSALRMLIPIVYMIFTFTVFYRFAPYTKNVHDVKLRNSLPGAIFTTLGWLTTSTIFSYYVNNFARYTITYGSIGGIIILLIWLYISSIIIVLGGEINATTKHFRSNGYKGIGDRSIIKKYL